MSDKELHNKVSVYSLQDCENAKAELRAVQTHWENYSGNNPDKYRGDLKAARSKLRAIESNLKERGELPLTEHERLERELNRAFPKARNKDIVEYRGKKYRLRYYPVERSRSRKSVTEWGKSWEEFAE